MKKQFTILPAIIASLMIASITYGQNVVKVNRTNQGQTISLSSTQILEIQLPVNVSTGYNWCESNSSADKSVRQSIEQVGESDFIDNPVNINGKSRIVGQSGTQILRYDGVSRGTAVLTLDLKREWEMNSPAIDSYTITVVSAGKYTGNFTPRVKATPKYDKPLTSVSSTLPSRWDFRPLCTPITNQGNCGSCWDFAACGAFEACINIIDGNIRAVSQQWVINCDSIGANGCQGGWFIPGASDLFQNDGAVYLSDLPYADASCFSVHGDTATCRSACVTYTHHEKIDSYGEIGDEGSTGIPPVDTLKAAIIKHGPIWVCVCAARHAWQIYKHGIFTEASDSSTDHAVVLVGWKDTIVTDGSGGYWIMRNSWGSGWGIKGYMYITYGTDKIGSYADYIVYKNGCNRLLPLTFSSDCYQDSLKYYTITGQKGYATGNNVYGFLEEAERYDNTDIGTISTVVVDEKTIKSPTTTANTFVNIYSVDAITKAPLALLGTSNAVAISAISKSGAYVTYSFATPVSISGAFYASLALPTITGDTLAVYATPKDFNIGDSLSWVKWNDGTWHSLLSNGNLGTGFNPELVIQPILCSSSLTNITKSSISNNGIYIYPNPATNNLIIESPQQAIINIINIQGQIIRTLAITGSKTNVDVSTLLSGVYIVEVRTGNGVDVRKFVKE